MNEKILFAFNPILNEPWAIDARRECLDGRYFVVYGKGLEDVSWKRDERGYYVG